MGRPGADLHPTDLRRLTYEERKAYVWACAEHAAGRNPSQPRLAAYMGLRANWPAWKLRESIRSKVGWPCQIWGRRAGTYGLTPCERSVLTAACAMWDEREYPSLSAIMRWMGWRGGNHKVVAARRLCLELKIWPCKVRRSKSKVSADEYDSIADDRRLGFPVHVLADKFNERWGRSISSATVYYALKRAGLVKSYRRRESDDSVEARKSKVIASRGGLCPSKIEEPPDGIRRVRPHSHGR